jgi:predicted nucleic acid-binding protein
MGAVRMIILGTNVLSELVEPDPNQHVVDWLNAPSHDEVSMGARVIRALSPYTGRAARA